MLYFQKHPHGLLHREICLVFHFLCAVFTFVSVCHWGHELSQRTPIKGQRTCPLGQLIISVNSHRQNVTFHQSLLWKLFHHKILHWYRSGNLIHPLLKQSQTCSQDALLILPYNWHIEPEHLDLQVLYLT